MPKSPDRAMVDQYRGEGYYFPVGVLDAREAAEHRARLEAFEAAQGKPVHGPQHNKSHLLFKWVDDLVDESKTAPIALAAGQASLHNVGLAHASGPNRTGDRRIGLSMHCISTRTRQTAGEWDRARHWCAARTGTSPASSPRCRPATSTRRRSPSTNGRAERCATSCSGMRSGCVP